MKVYFAGSIRGGRVDANLYERLIKYIQKTDIVLTEHVGNLNLSEERQTQRENTFFIFIFYIYAYRNNKINYIRKCHLSQKNRLIKGLIA